MAGKRSYQRKTGNDRKNINRKRDGNRRSDENNKNAGNRSAAQKNLKDTGSGKGYFRYRDRSSVRNNENRGARYSFKSKPFEEETVEDTG